MPNVSTILPFFATIFNTQTSINASRADLDMRPAPILSVSHGGGPMPLLGDPSQRALAESLRTRAHKALNLDLPPAQQPRAIIVVTAHWQEQKVHISAAPKHELYYDYYGFPDEAYKIKYEARGDPEVAGLVRKALSEAGIESVLDKKRGWDHGLFVPLKLILPNPHPVTSPALIQVSVLSSASPASHFAIGRALRPLLRQNIALVGSGFASIHNLRAMFGGATSTSAFREKHALFNDRLRAAMKIRTSEARAKEFEQWRQWEGSYDMHPRGGEEHFLPAVVCAGALGDLSDEEDDGYGGGGQETGRREVGEYVDDFLGLGAWSFYWK